MEHFLDDPYNVTPLAAPAANFTGTQGVSGWSSPSHLERHRNGTGDSGYFSDSGGLCSGNSFYGADTRQLSSWKTAVPAWTSRLPEAGAPLVEEPFTSSSITPLPLGGPAADVQADVPLAPPQVAQYGNTGNHLILERQAYIAEPEAPKQPVSIQQLPPPRVLYVYQSLYTLPKSKKLFRGQQPISFELSPGVGVLLSHFLRDPTGIPGTWSTLPGMPHGSGQKAQIRINWPGRRSFARSINILNFVKVAKDRQPISKIALLTRVAKVVQTMVEVNDDIASPEDDMWRIGKGGVRFENIMLHSLKHVSKSSWQPLLSLWFGGAGGVGAAA